MLDSVVIISFNEGCLAPQLPLQQSPSIFSLSHFHQKISHCLSKIASLALTPVSCSVINSLTLSPFIVHCVKVLVTGFVRQ